MSRLRKPKSRPIAPVRPLRTPARRPPDPPPRPSVAKAARPPESRRIDPPVADESPSARVRGAGQIRRADAVEAWKILADPLHRGEAIRVGAIGVTGMGKTTGLQDFLEFAKARWQIVLVHDIKKREPQYRGEVISKADEVYDTPPERYPAVLVVRDMGSIVEPTAEVAWNLGGAGIKTCLVIDELAYAITEGGRGWTSPTVPQIFMQGLGRDVSCLWTTQLAQRAPAAAYDMSVVMLFNPGKKASKYLEQNNSVDSDQLAILPTLKRREFILTAQDADWDRTIYTVAERRLGNAKPGVPASGDEM